MLVTPDPQLFKMSPCCCSQLCPCLSLPARAPCHTAGLLPALPHFFSFHYVLSGGRRLHAPFKTHTQHGFIQQYNDVFCFAASSFPNHSLPPPPFQLMLQSFPPQDGSRSPSWVVIANVRTHPLITVFPHITSTFINMEFHLPFYHPLTLYPAALCSLQLITAISWKNKLITVEKLTPYSTVWGAAYVGGGADCLNFFPAINRGPSVHSHPLPRGAGLIEAPSSAKRAKDHMHNTPLFPYCWQLSPNRLLMTVTYPHSPPVLTFPSTTASQ